MLAVVSDADAHDLMPLIDAGRDREAALRGAGTRPGGTMDPITQLDQLAGPLGAVIAGLTPTDLDRPTPCQDFTVGGVLEHMLGGATAFAAAFRGVEPTTAEGDEPIQAVGAALEQL